MKNSLRQHLVPSDFRGRKLPGFYRFLSALRVLAFTPTIVVNSKKQSRTKVERSTLESRWLSDLVNCTSGFGLDYLALFIRFLKRKETKEFDLSFKRNTLNFLCPFMSSTVKNTVTELRRSGVVRLNAPLPHALSFSAQQLVELSPGRSQNGSVLWKCLSEWKEAGCPGLRFDTEMKVLGSNVEIMSIIRHPLIVAIAREYLNSNPILGPIESWTTGPSINFSSDDLDTAAMAYHCDSDYVSFLKFFVLLTPVGPTNGPFQFVVGSHKGPRHVAGRMPDSEIVSTTDLVFSGIGEVGDLIIADTRGWHKATQVAEGCRSMLQIMYTSSLFGRAVG